jgi:hypothetical protein
MQKINFLSSAYNVLFLAFSKKKYFFNGPLGATIGFSL